VCRVTIFPSPHLLVLLLLRGGRLFLCLLLRLQRLREPRNQLRLEALWAHVATLQLTAEVQDLGVVGTYVSKMVSLLTELNALLCIATSWNLLNKNLSAPWKDYHNKQLQNELKLLMHLSYDMATKWLQYLKSIHIQTQKHKVKPSWTWGPVRRSVLDLSSRWLHHLPPPPHRPREIQIEHTGYFCHHLIKSSISYNTTHVIRSMN